VTEDQGPLDDAAKADGLGTTSTYYRGRFDARRCMFPLCGGAWVRRVNATTTKCSDGKYQAECYVAEIDVSRLALKSDYLDEQVRSRFEAGTVVLRGNLAAGTLGTFKIARLLAREAWMAAADGAPAASDRFYRASDSGIRCFTTPCPSIHVAKLNSTTARNIDGIDLSQVPGTEADREAASDDLMRRGLVVAAHLQQTREGMIVQTSQAYRRVIPAAGGLCGAGSPCGPAQLCCYPCGIQGCKNVCMAVESCPLYP
jgi:hypothetical protein